MTDLKPIDFKGVGCTVNTHPERKAGPYHRACGRPAVAFVSPHLLCRKHAREKRAELMRLVGDIDRGLGTAGSCPECGGWGAPVGCGSCGNRSMGG